MSLFIPPAAAPGSIGSFRADPARVPASVCTQLNGVAGVGPAQALTTGTRRSFFGGPRRFASSRGAFLAVGRPAALRAAAGGGGEEDDDGGSWSEVFESDEFGDASDRRPQRSFRGSGDRDRPRRDSYGDRDGRGERRSFGRDSYGGERGRGGGWGERSRGGGGWGQRSSSSDNRPRYSEDRPRYSEDRPRYSEDRPRYSEDRPRYSEDRPRYSEDRPRHGDNRPRYGEDRRERFGDREPYGGRRAERGGYGEEQRERATTYDEARLRLRRAERRRVPRPRWDEEEEGQEEGGVLVLHAWREVRRRGGRREEEPRGEGELRSGDAVDLEVAEFTRLGMRVLVNGHLDGLVFDNDIQREDIEIGDTMKGYVKMVRPDGKLDISLRKPGLAGVQDAGRAVLAALREAGGELPYGDGTTPEEVKAIFSMSKSVFKRALGNLWKEGRIEWTEGGGIRLVDRRPRTPAPSRQ